MNEKTWSSISSSHLLFMKIIGLIPFEGKTFAWSASRFCTFFCHMINMSYNSMWSGYGLTNVNEVGYMSEIIVVQSVFFRYLVLYLNRTRLAKLVLTCRELWSSLRDNENRMMMTFERKAFYFRVVILSNGIVVVSLFIATTFLIEFPAASARNETKKLIFRYWSDVHEEPAWSIVTLWQIVVAYSVTIETTCLETVGLFFTMMASGYLRVLQIRLRRLNDRKSNSALLYDEVLKCVKYHQKIMRFCEDIDLAMSKAFFVVVLTSTYNLAIIATKLLDANEQVVIFKYVTLLLFNLFPIFTAQYGPEYLQTESQAIGQAAYFASLSQPVFDPSANKMLFFIMMRAQRPIQLTAGGFISLSMESFGKMLKSAGSFFALLRSIRD